MTTWASEMSQYRDSSDNIIPAVRKYVFDTTTDADGQYLIDLSSLNVSSVLEVHSYILGQGLSPVTDTSNILHSKVIEVSNLLVKGVVLKGNSVTVSVGLLVKTLLRGSGGLNIRLVVTCV